MKISVVHSQSAFTLIELMLAMAIFAILTILVFTIVNNTANVITTTSKNLDTFRVARECLDVIENDLSVATTPYDNRVNYTANTSYNSTKQSLQMVVNPVGVSSKYCQPHTIFWQAPVSRSTAYGNMAVIGYYVLRDLQANPKDNRLQLRRLYVEPEAPPPLSPASPKYLIYSTPSAWYPNSLLALFAPGTAALDNSNGQEGWMADGVLAMWIRCLDPNGSSIVKKADGTTITYTYDSRDSYQYKDSANVIHYPAISPPVSPAVTVVPAVAVLPAFIEVGLVCTSPSDASHITALPAPAPADPTKFYQEIDNFTQAARLSNPQNKSIASFSRKFRIYSTHLP